MARSQFGVSLLYARLGRKPPRVGEAKARPPHVKLLEREYQRRLAALLAQLWDRIETMARGSLRADSSEWRQDAFEDDMRAAWRAMVEAAGIADWVARAGGNIATIQAKYVERITRIPPRAGDGTQAAIEAFRRENVSLITRMGEDGISQVADILRPAQAVGERWEEVAPRIQERLGVSRSRAKLIARDQTNKFNGAMQKLKQEEAGVRRYRWSTTKSMSVRGRPGGIYENSQANHWALEGKVFSWDDPPIIPGTSERAHPGEQIQCECVAIPIIEAFGGDLPDAPAPKRTAPRVASLPSPIPQDLTKGGRLPLRAESFAHLRGGGATTPALPVSVAVYPDGTVFPRDGRHRITLARERGETTIEGNVIRVGKRGAEKVQKKVRIPI